MTEVPLKWTDYNVGMTLSELKQAGILFKRKEWDLKGEQFIGVSFTHLAPILIRESRFDPNRFNPDPQFGPYQGGILRAYLKSYVPKQHEQVNEIRQTGEGGIEFMQSIDVLPNGELSTEYNPLTDTSLAKDGLVVAFSSTVQLNNLSCPGTFGGYAQFPMLDIVHPPTPENAKELIEKVKKRCGLDKFFVLRSSEHGMMVVGTELFDQENFKAFLDSSLLLNHMETEGEYWVDDRWVAHSSQKYVELTGNAINPLRYCAELRVTALPPSKPEVPIIIASSF